MQNVHVFDGQLNHLYQPTKLFTTEEKEKLIRGFIETTQNEDVKCVAKEMLTRTDTVDTANNIDWVNLFADILEHPMHADIFPLLEEQLVDAKRLGSCPQGLSTRLLQIWLALRLL